MFTQNDMKTIFRESAVTHPKLRQQTKSSMDLARRLESRRVIKSHLPVALLPTNIWNVKPAVIYVARNPKTLAAQYYDYYVQTHGYHGTIAEFVELFIGDSVMYAPIHSHITEFYALKDDPNILFATYEEDIEDDLFGFIQRIAAFIDVEVTDEQVQELATHGMNIMQATESNEDLDNMDKLWKRNKRNDEYSATVLSEELADKIEEWNTANLTNCEFRFSK